MQGSNRSQRGFTLIELMVTVAIVAILAAVAYPAYTKYVLRGYRSEGIAMLSDAAARMERFYAQNNRYTPTDLMALGFTSTAPLTQSGKYLLKMPTATNTTYTFQVVPQGTQAKDSCGTMSIAQDGTKTSSTSATDCF
jgi:type IV pilus assembly protein PilE